MVEYTINNGLFGSVKLKYKAMFGHNAKTWKEKEFTQRMDAVRFIKHEAQTELCNVVKSYIDQQNYVLSHFGAHDRARKLLAISKLKNNYQYLHASADLQSACRYVLYFVLESLKELLPYKESKLHKSSKEKVEAIEKFCRKVHEKQKQIISENGVILANS